MGSSALNLCVHPKHHSTRPGKEAAAGRGHPAVESHASLAAPGQELGPHTPQVQENLLCTVHSLQTGQCFEQPPHWEKRTWLSPGGSNQWITDEGRASPPQIESKQRFCWFCTKMGWGQGSSAAASFHNPSPHSGQRPFPPALHCSNPFKTPITPRENTKHQFRIFTASASKVTNLNYYCLHSAPASQAS